VSLTAWITSGRNPRDTLTIRLHIVNRRTRRRTSRTVDKGAPQGSRASAVTRRLDGAVTRVGDTADPFVPRRETGSHGFAFRSRDLGRISFVRQSFKCFNCLFARRNVHDLLLCSQQTRRNSRCCLRFGCQHQPAERDRHGRRQVSTVRLPTGLHHLSGLNHTHSLPILCSR
jgi:hypothetical protein